MKKGLILYGVLVISTLAVISCKEDVASGNATIRVRLHDQAIDYDSVNVEIVGVKLHHDEEGWISVPAQAGMYNLLDFQNGVDTLIVPDQSFPSGHVSQFRLLLGDNNYVVVNGEAHDLELSSQDVSGLKLNLHQDINVDEDYTIIVDFDASQSVLLNGNGTYRLKPVLSAEVEY